MKGKIFKWFSFGVIFLVVVFSTALFVLNSPDSPNYKFAEQAQSFLQGRTDITQGTDTIYFNGKYYWHQNFFPSIVLIPALLITGYKYSQPLMQIILLGLLVYFIYKLARLKKFNHSSSLWLVFVFLFGSVMIHLITDPGCYYQILATALLTALVYEYETRKRYWVMGLLEAGIIGTRPTAAFLGLIIIWMIFSTNKLKPARKLYNLLAFILPGIVMILLLLGFNYIRFHDPFFNTYIASNSLPMLNSLKVWGVFSIAHIPSSIYYYFLISYVPITVKMVHLVFPYITYNPLGLSFFLVCPFFLYAFKNFKYSFQQLKAYWLVVLITLVCLLSFFGMAGYITFGPRYTADFLPILFLLVLKGLKPPSLTKGQIAIILISAGLNTYLIITSSAVHFIYYFGN